MGDVREATEALLENRPELEAKLRKLLEVDEVNDTWTFEDVPFDSGTFGEIVSSGVVIKIDGSYQISDHGAVRAALENDNTEEESVDGWDYHSLINKDIDWQSAVLIGGILVMGGLIRVGFIWSSVYRDGQVVLAGNDPYLYVSWIEMLLAADIKAFDIFALGDLPAGVPPSSPIPAIENHDILFILLAWWGAALFGGESAAPHIIAWIPVIAGVTSMVFVYLSATRLMADRRVGIAATALLAITPVHAFRTALGFGDHHALDIAILSITVYAIIVCLNSSQIKKKGVILVGLAIMSQTLAWRGGPLLLTPIAIYLVLGTIVDIIENEPPHRTQGPLLVGITGGAVVTISFHMILGWMPFPRAIAPLLLAFGGGITVALGWITLQKGMEIHTFVVGETIFGGLMVIFGWLVIPDIREAVTGLFAYFQWTQGSGVAETVSLFSTSMGLFVGPFLLFGIILYLSSPIIIIGTVIGVKNRAHSWLAVGSYALFLIAFAILQIRFAGPLSVLTAIFGGYAFVALLNRLDIIENSPSMTNAKKQLPKLSIPSNETLRMIVIVFLLVGSVGLIQTPVKINQVAIDQPTYETAKWINEATDRQSANPTSTYVFSQWGQNRMYNYFVSGDGISYGFARQNYEEFISSNSPGSWYFRLRHRTTFVVTTSVGGSVPSDTIQMRLHANHGSRTANEEAVQHYREVFATSDGSHRVFKLVPGVRIIGRINSDSSTTAEVQVTIPGERFSYSQRINGSSKEGFFRATLPYPGTYLIGNQSVNVSVADVEQGRTIRLAGEAPNEWWRLDDLHGTTTPSAVSRSTATVKGANAADGIIGGALSFDGEDDVVNLGPAAPDLTGEREFTVCAWANPTSGGETHQHIVHLGNFEAFVARNPGDGTWQAYFHNGERPYSVSSQQSSNGWTHVCARYDGDQLALYIDGNLTRTTDASGTVRAEAAGGTIGATPNGGRHFSGTIDEVRVYDVALSPETIAELADSGE